MVCWGHTHAAHHTDICFPPDQTECISVRKGSALPRPAHRSVRRLGLQLRQARALSSQHLPTFTLRLEDGRDRRRGQWDQKRQCYSSPGLSRAMQLRSKCACSIPQNKKPLFDQARLFKTPFIVIHPYPVLLIEVSRTKPEFPVPEELHAPSFPCLVTFPAAVCCPQMLQHVLETRAWDTAQLALSLLQFRSPVCLFIYLVCSFLWYKIRILGQIIPKFSHNSSTL